MTTDETSTRIRRIRTEFCHDDNSEFARRIGKSHQHASALCSGKSKAGTQTLALILRAFPTVRAEWLYFGTGKMSDTTPAPAATASAIYADIADTFTHLAQQFSRLALCDK